MIFFKNKLFDFIQVKFFLIKKKEMLFKRSTKV